MMTQQLNSDKMPLSRLDLRALYIPSTIRRMLKSVWTAGDDVIADVIYAKNSRTLY